RNGGRMRETAAELGIDERSLRRKLRRLGIDRQQVRGSDEPRSRNQEGARKLTAENAESAETISSLARARRDVWAPLCVLCALCGESSLVWRVESSLTGKLTLRCAGRCKPAADEIRSRAMTSSRDRRRSPRVAIDLPIELRFTLDPAVRGRAS